MQTPCPARDLIQHRPPVCFVDELLDAGNPFRSCFTVPAHSPYTVDGVLLPEALLEIMAQCFAAGAGFRALAAGRELTWGYIVNVRHFKVLQDVHTGDTVEAVCSVETTIGHIHVIEAEVSSGGTLLASAQFKVFTPGDIVTA